MTDETQTDDTDVTDHLDDLPDGSGCTEIWEHLSGERDADAGDDADERSDPCCTAGEVD